MAQLSPQSDHTTLPWFIQNLINMNQFDSIFRDLECFFIILILYYFILYIVKWCYVKYKIIHYDVLYHNIFAI